MIRQLQPLAFISPALIIVLALSACENLEVADYNSDFRPVPTIERAPTPEIAPTVAPAPTATQFEGFKQAPTITQAEGFKQAPTVTQFQGFNDDENPCTVFLEQPSPQNAKRAAEWAIARLESTDRQIDPNDTLQITTACQDALNK